MWKGDLIKAGIESDGYNINIWRGNLTVYGSLTFTGGVEFEGAITIDDTITFEDDATFEGQILSTGTVAKGIDFTDATLTQGWENGFFVVGSGNGATGDQHSVTTTDFYIPIQVNMVSIANPDDPTHFTAAMFRTDISTADQDKTLCNPIAVRAKIAKDIYGGSGINVDMEVSDAISIGTESLKSGYFAISGDGAITCTGDCNVLEAVYKQTSGGGGVDNVAQFHVNATGCSVADILHLRNVAGTVTNALYIEGAITTAINLGGTFTTDIAFSSGGTIKSTADTLTLEEATLTFTGGTAINLDGPTTVTGILTIDTAGSPADGIKISATTPTDGLEISSVCGSHAINISAAQTGTGITVASTWGVGIDGGAIVIGDYSNAIAFGEVAEHVVGICVNLSGSIDDTSNFIPIHGKFATTADCVTNAGAQAVYGRIDIAHNLSSSYAVRGAITMTGAPEVNQVYGMFSTMALAGCNLAETGQVAGLAIELTGSEDITTSGTYGKVSGIRVAWEHTNAMTVDTCGIYVSCKSGATLDSGYRVNSAGSITDMFHSFNSGSVPTNALKIEGAHTNAFAFPAADTAPSGSNTSGSSTLDFANWVPVKVTIGGVAHYMVAAQTVSATGS